MQEGVVVEYHREYCWVEFAGPEGGVQEVVAKPRGRLELAGRVRDRQAREEREPERVVTQQFAVGDRVVVSEIDQGQWVIDAIIERETWLIRKNLSRYNRKPQCVVANADQLAIVIAPRPELHLNVVDRYILAATQGGLVPLVIVNKIDLDPRLPGSVEFLAYSEMGYPVFFTNAKTGAGLAEMQSMLQGKFTAFCGHSGVGKSTILSRLTGVEISVGLVHAGTQKGRQTTTTARLYHLPGGGEVVDTPGVREFGLAHLTWLDVHDYFADIAALTTDCGFRDCSHTVEPGCRVRQAVTDGKLSANRLDSYIKLREECVQEGKTWT